MAWSIKPFAVVGLSHDACVVQYDGLTAKLALERWTDDWPHEWSLKHQLGFVCQVMMRKSEILFDTEETR